MSLVSKKPDAVRRRRAGRRPTSVVAIGLLVIGLFATVALVALRAPSGLPLRDYQKLYASVPDSGNLRPHNDVRIAGVRVGQLLSRRVRGARAVLELQLDPGVGPLPTDTSVFIRGRGLLGQRYVELVPGSSPRALREGSVIDGGDTAVTFGVPETLDTFDRQTRGALGTVIRELGNGLLARGTQTNRALRTAPQSERDFQAATQTILARPGALRRLAPSLDGAASAAAPAADDFASGFEPAADSLQPFVVRRQRLRQTLDVAPSTLAAAHPALVEGRRLLRAARAVAGAASDTLPRAPGGLRAAVRLLRESPLPLRRAASLLRSTRRAVPGVLRITRSAAPVLEPLRQALVTLRPPVIKLGEYGCDLDNFAENWRDFLSYGVAGGGQFGPLIDIRIEAISGPGNVAGGGDLARAPDALIDRDPYPRPCRFSPGREYPLTTLGPGGSR